MRPGPSKKKKICQDHKAKGCSSVMGRLPRRAGDAEAKQMQRRDMMGTGFWLQLFLQAQGVFKAKYDFHCQEKLLLSYCSLLFDRGSEGGQGGKLAATCTVGVFRKKAGI